MSASGVEGGSGEVRRNAAGRGKGILLPGLRGAREEAGRTIRELEAESGVARSTIHALEKGERGAQGRTIKALAQALGVSARRLTTGREDERASREGAATLLALAVDRLADATGHGQAETLEGLRRDYEREHGSVLTVAGLPLEEALSRVKDASREPVGVPAGEAEEFPPGEGVSDLLLTDKRRRDY